MRRAAADELHIVQRLFECRLDTFPKRCHMLQRLPHLLFPELCRRAEGSDLRRGFGAGAHAALLTAAENIRRKLQAAADIERADALRRVDLVTADRDEICAELVCANRNFQESLHCISVQQRLAFGFAERARNGSDVRHGTGFVIHHHERYEDRIRPQCRCNLLR